MLAFTLGMAGSRFDQRRELLLDEANAIGTARLRADLVPEPTRGEPCCAATWTPGSKAAASGGGPEAVAKSVGGQ